MDNLSNPPICAIASINPYGLIAKLRHNPFEVFHALARNLVVFGSFGGCKVTLPAGRGAQAGAPSERTPTMKPENKMIWKTLTSDASIENLNSAANYAQRCKALVDYLAGPHCVTENNTAETARRIMYDAYRKLLDIAPTK